MIIVEIRIELERFSDINFRYQDAKSITDMITPAPHLILHLFQQENLGFCLRSPLF